jgi:hypothetical protein
VDIAPTLPSYNITTPLYNEGGRMGAGPSENVTYIFLGKGGKEKCKLHFARGCFEGVKM